MSIVILPESVVSRIAAGEAVERPASAVKELIENAIDAGASSINVEAEAGGKRLMRISDNGAGIRKDELALAFKRHATSKLRDSADLQAISTLGFRGEALASIAAVSQVTVHTRHREDDMGSSMRLNGGDIVTQRSVGAPAGTVITIENLFFNTPARLKFLKRDATEKRHILQVVERYALAYPRIAFALRQDGREQFRSSGRGELADVAARVFGHSAINRMVKVASDDSGWRGSVPIQVRGFASWPSLTRKDRSKIILFVNGRAIQDASLSHAVTQAYDGMINAGSFPLAALLISLPPEQVDVNVHPTKAEVRFRDGYQVFAAVQRSVRQALQTAEPDASSTDPWISNGFNETVAGYQPWRSSIRLLESGDSFDDADLAFVPEGADSPQKPRTLPLLRVVGQIGAAYIVAEGPAGMYLVDQNAAHERLLYEQIREQHELGQLETVKPDESQTILLSPDDASRLRDLADTFAQLGFEIEEFGPNTFVVRALPHCVASLRSGDVITEMLARLNGGSKSLGDAIAALAEVAAVRSGQILQSDEMKTLLAGLERCPSPMASPNGRTTLVHLTREQLASEFRR